MSAVAAMRSFCSLILEGDEAHNVSDSELCNREVNARDEHGVPVTIVKWQLRQWGRGNATSFTEQQCSCSNEKTCRFWSAARMHSALIPESFATQRTLTCFC